MKQKLFWAGIICLAVALNSVMLERSLKFANMYPFGRLLVGNALLYGADTEGAPWIYGSRIVTVNGAVAAGRNAVDLLSRGWVDDRLYVEIESAGGTFNGEFSKGTLNRGIMWFFLFLILCANLHLFWAAVIGVLYPSRYLARVAALLLVVCGFFFLSLVEFLSFRHWLPLTFLSGTLCAYLFVAISSLLGNHRINPAASAAVLLPGAAFLVINTAFPSLLDELRLFRMFFLYMSASSLFSVLRIAFAGMKDAPAPVLGRNRIVLAFIAAGFTVPLGMLGLWTIVDLKIPLYVIPLTACIMPLGIGGGMIESSIPAARNRAMENITSALVVLSMGLAVSFMLFYTVNVSGTLNELVFYCGILALFVLLVFRLLYAIRWRLRSPDETERDRYADSLQNIAELVSSPAELQVKLQMIFSEVKRIAGATSLKFLLFGEVNADEYRPGMSEYTEHVAGERLLSSFLDENRDVLVHHALVDSNHRERQVHNFMLERRAVLMLPCFKGPKLKGALLVGEKNGGDVYTREDVGYLQTVAFQVNQLIENDRLFNEFIVKRRYEKELDIASYIQLRLFPRQVPSGRGMYINLYNRPFIKVTGDYYDFIAIDRDRTAVVIGDVSGHGLSASMILSMTSSIVNAMLIEKKTIQNAMEEINHFLTRRYHGVDLISLFIAIYHKSTGELVYINAGHCAPMVIRKDAGEIAFLEGRSKILGADFQANYYSSKCTLGRGDRIFLYTDGIVEIYNEKSEELFGETGLQNLIVRHHEKGIDATIRAVAETVNGFRSEVINDDITVIGIEVL